MWRGLVAPLKHLKLIYIKIVKQHTGKWAWQCRNAADFCCLTGKNVNKRDLRKELWQGSSGGGCRVAGSWEHLYLLYLLFHAFKALRENLLFGGFIWRVRAWRAFDSFVYCCVSSEVCVVEPIVFLHQMWLIFDAIYRRKCIVGARSPRPV